MNEDIEWLNSKCVGTWLHDFKIYQANDKGVHEVCRKCGESAYFTTINGKVDNLDYLNYHLRSALPKYHPYYKNEYDLRKS